jgi:hypothetical protein
VSRELLVSANFFGNALEKLQIPFSWSELVSIAPLSGTAARLKYRRPPSPRQNNQSTAPIRRVREPHPGRVHGGLEMPTKAKTSPVKNS